MWSNIHVYRLSNFYWNISLFEGIKWFIYSPIGLKLILPSKIFFWEFSLPSSPKITPLDVYFVRRSELIWYFKRHSIYNYKVHTEKWYKQQKRNPNKQQVKRSNNTLSINLEYMSCLQVFKKENINLQSQIILFCVDIFSLIGVRPSMGIQMVFSK